MQYLEVTYPTIAENLALDEALLIEADEGRAGPVLRIWELAEPAVVLGSTCRIRDDLILERCRDDQIAISRRSSGGGTVVIGAGALNVAVVLRIDSAPGLGFVDVAQRHVLEAIAASLKQRGALVELLGSSDLTIGGRKFAGSAQRRLRHHFLVHTSILYGFPLDLITRYTKLPTRQPAYRAQRSHEDFLTNLNMTRDELVTAIRSAWQDPNMPWNLPAELIQELVASKFGNPAWIERL